MENYIVRIVISLVMLSGCVSGRFVHQIEDWNMPVAETVAECRRGCLMKVCALCQ